MKKTVHNFAAAGLLLTLILAIASTALAQIPVLVDVRVLELPRAEIDKLGKSQSGSGSAKALTKEAAAMLLNGPLAKKVHSLELQGLNGKPTQLRVDSRIPVDSTAGVDAPSFYEAGISVEVLPRIFQDRDIAVATTSQVRVGRGPAVNGGVPVVFESSPIKFETPLHEGETLMLGGFITDTERTSLPLIPGLPNNPIVNYLFSRGGISPDRSEVVVLLTPRIVGPVIDAVRNYLSAPLTVAAPAAPAAAPAGKDVLGLYTVQVGAFESSEKAEALVAVVAKRYDSVFVDKASTGRTPYRVRVGRLPDQRAARELQRRLSRDGFDTYVTALEK